MALLIDSATYGVSAALVARIRLPARQRKQSVRFDWKTVTGVRDFTEGLSFIAHRKDVATVIYAEPLPTYRRHLNGERAVAFEIQRASGANIAQLSKDVRSALDTIRVTGGLRPDRHWEVNRAAAIENARLARRMGRLRRPPR